MNPRARDLAGPLAGAGGALLALAALVVLVGAPAPPAAAPDGVTAPRPPRIAPGDGPGAAGAGPNADLVARGPQFFVTCGHSHSRPDDPIVHAGHDGGSHLHDFFGATTTAASSTAADLLGAPTTCTVAEDHAAYWVPALLDQGEPVVPVAADVYYRVAGGLEPGAVEPYPFGLAMVAGDAHAGAAQPLDVVAWGCGLTPLVGPVPPTCPETRPLTLRVTFPDCWDGRRLDSPDHRSHVARSGPDGCPASHPVALPLLTLVVRYDRSGPGAGLALSSGPVTTAHADFLNAWDPDRLDLEVRSCLHREVVCGIPTPRRR